MALSLRNVSCLTGACMLVHAQDFWDVGGWDDANTPISHSDFDLSYRLLDAGFRLVYQPFAELRHLGHQSRRAKDHAGPTMRADHGADVYLLHRWGERVSEDPYYTRGMRDLLYENPVDYEVLTPHAMELETEWSSLPRVLLCAHDLSLSGAPIVLLEVAKALRADGMLVVVAAPRAGPLAERLVSDGIPVIVDGDITANPELSHRFLRGFDVIGANTVLTWRVVHAAKGMGKPCVWLIQEPRFGLKIIEAGGRRAKEAFQHADRIVFPSQGTAELYERYGGVSRHIAIHYGISDVREEIIEAPIQHRNEWIRVVSVRSLEPRKAQHVLLDALERLAPETRKRIQLLLVGRTLPPESYAKKLHAWGAKLSVEFAGEVPREVGLASIRDSDIFVCSSIDESGPLCVIEAMALGRPVISTTVGAAAEVITSGMNGELVDPGDPIALASRIERMVRDPDLRRTLGDQARRRYEDYLTSERYGRDIVEVFRTVLVEDDQRGVTDTRSSVGGRPKSAAASARPASAGDGGAGPSTSRTITAAMTEELLPNVAWLEDPDQVSDYGERVSHLVRDFTFYGHLSIYDFATQFCRDAVVLDAGSGAGYGAAHLADAGARHVYGVDLSAKAVEFSKRHYQQPKLAFEVGDLEQLAFPAGTFDFIFTSNTLEHVADVPGFLRAAHTSLKPAGAMLVAVPPITDDRLVYLNVINRYHLNIWSPRQWEFVLGQFFVEVSVYLHGVTDLAAAHASGSADANEALSEKEFTFTEGTVPDMYTTPTLTAIFVARAPRPADSLPAASSPPTFVDDSFSRATGYIDPEVERRLQPYFDAPTESPPDPADSSAGLHVTDPP